MSGQNRSEHGRNERRVCMAHSLACSVLDRLAIAIFLQQICERTGRLATLG